MEEEKKFKGKKRAGGRTKSSRRNKGRAKIRKRTRRANAIKFKDVGSSLYVKKYQNYESYINNGRSLVSDLRNTQPDNHAPAGESTA